MLIPWWYMSMVRDPFLFLFQNPKFYQDFNETTLEPLTMSQKALKMLLNSSDDVNAAARLI